MTRILPLSCGHFACEVAPALGGSIVRLQYDGLDVLRRPPTDLSSARQASSYPLVPWSNRIGGAWLRWHGQERSLARNNPPEPHAIHGTGWQDAWELAEFGVDRAVLRLVHAADERWPWPFEAVQRFQLAEHALELELSLTNWGEQPMPAGLGWHPFFVKRPEARVQVRTRGRWEMSPCKLPTHRADHLGLEGPCEGLDVDHCFDGWEGAARLEDGRLRVELTSSLGHIVVFTTPERDVIALEPVSHVNNVYGDPAIARHPAALTGARELAPGAAMHARARIAVRPAR